VTLLLQIRCEGFNFFLKSIFLRVSHTAAWRNWIAHQTSNLGVVSSSLTVVGNFFQFFLLHIETIIDHNIIHSVFKYDRTNRLVSSLIS
jgi:hypothetical protein